MHVSEGNANDSGMNIQYIAFHPKAQLLVDIVGRSSDLLHCLQAFPFISEQWHEDANNLKELTATGIVLVLHQIPF